MDDRESLQDQIRSAVNDGIEHFRVTRPDATISNDTIDILMGFVDSDYTAQRLGEDRLSEVAEYTSKFLFRIADAYPEIMPNVTKKGLFPHQQEPWTPERIVIDMNSLRRARTQFFCTIFPFCKPD